MFPSSALFTAFVFVINCAEDGDAQLTTVANIERSDCFCTYNIPDSALAAYEGNRFLTKGAKVPRGKEVQFHCNKPGKFHFEGPRSIICEHDCSWNTEEFPFCPEPEGDDIEIIVNADPPGNIYVRPGGNFSVIPETELTVQCQLNYSKRTTLVWILPKLADGQKTENFDNHTGRYNITYYIEDAQPNHSGEYTCFEDRGKRHSIFINVEGIACKPPDAIEHGTVLYNSLEYGSSLQYKCDEGYQLSSNETIICDAYGEWNGTDILCEVIYCTQPEHPSNGKATYTSLVLGSVVSYECYEGYELASSRERECGPDGEWTGSDPFCKVISCQRPNEPVNGKALYSSLEFESELIYKCDRGYELSFDETRICGPDARWNGTEPLCAAITCKIPNHPVHGKATYNGLEYRSVVSYACNLGYRLVPEISRLCGLDGKWSDIEPSCEAIICQRPENPEHGKASYTTLTYHSVVTYECDEGHYLSPNQERTCGLDGEWTGSKPICKAITCKKPNNPNHGKALYRKLEYSSEVSYICDQGYQLSPNKSRACGPGGEWTGIEPSCTALTCKIPNHPIYGKATYNGLEYRSVVSYTCNLGYRLVPEISRLCGLDGKWSGIEPSCEAITCKKPENPEHGKASYTALIYHSVVTYECDEGHYLSPNQERKCGLDGEWTGSKPICKAITCKKPNDPNHGKALYGRLEYSSEVSYICDQGYQLSPNKSRVCGPGGEWSGIEPSCTAIRCTSPKNPEHGKVSYVSLEYQSVITYECDKGYQLSSGMRRTCDADGHWTGISPFCTAIECQKPRNPQNGRAFYGSLKYGSELTYGCDPGYDVTFKQTRLCGSDGQWTSSEPVCEAVHCERPRDPQNGRAIYMSRQRGSELIYECYTGYRLSATFSRMCDANGEWTGSMPFCEIIQCETPTNPDKGRAVYTALQYDSKLSYVCDEGYQLSFVHTRICGSDGEWTSSEPFCNVVHCKTPADPGHGRAMYTSLELYSEVTYECQAGYRLSSNATKICGLDGQWVGDEPLCEEIECELPDEPDFGSLTFHESKAKVGSVISFACSPGRKLVGSASSTCMQSGQWTFTAPRCIVPCEVPSVKNGQFQRYEEGQGSSILLAAFKLIPVGTLLDDSMKITLKCQNNYVHRSTRQREVTITCRNGVLSPVPECKAIFCAGEPPPIENGEAVVTSRNHGDVTSYRCKENSKKIKSGKVKCVWGTWTGPMPVCKDTGCYKDALNYPGLVIEKPNYFPDGASFQPICAIGYEIENMIDTNIFCDGGTWKGNLPPCALARCRTEDLLNFPGVTLKSSGIFSNGEWFQPTCDVGYQLTDNNDSNVYCFDGEWTGNIPPCSLARCRADDLLNFPGIVLEKSDLVFEHRESFHPECAEGYEFNNKNDSMLFCIDGKWEGNVPPCSPARCRTEDLLKFPGIFLEVDHVVEDGEWIQPECTVGYESSNKNDSKIYCLEGKWAGNVPPCSPAQCLYPPPVLTNGWIKFIGGKDHGSRAEYECSMPYLMEGENILLCSYGEWSGRLPTCKDSRCHLRNLPHKEGVDTTDDRPVNSAEKADIVCTKGYILRNTNIYCRGGEWIMEDALPPCEKTRCRKEDLLNYPGIVIEGERVLEDGQWIQPKCSVGYEFTNKNHSKVFCLEGEWAGNIPPCSPVKCLYSPPALQNGRIKFIGGREHGARAEYECLKPYLMEGEKSVVCSYGKWSVPLPTCKDSRCYLRNLPHKEGVDTTDGRPVSSEQKADIVCTQGYNLKNTNIYCRGGEWIMEATLSPCEITVCRTEDLLNFPGFILEGERVLKHGEWLQPKCSEGHDINNKNHSQIFCLDGQWTGNVPPCSPAQCLQNPPPLRNGRIMLRGSKSHGASVHYECLQPYVMEGENTVICSFGKWTGSPPRCQDSVRCPKIQETNELRITYSNDRSINSRVYFHCFPPSERDGPSYATCKSSGLWSSAPPTCLLPKCSLNSLRSAIPYDIVPYTDENLSRDVHVPYGYIQPLNCRQAGMAIKGVDTAKCIADGEWEVGQKFDCVEGCSRLRTRKGSELLVSPSKHIYEIGESVALSCPEGEFLTQNVERILCFVTGWTPSVVPDCTSEQESKI